MFKATLPPPLYGVWSVDLYSLTASHAGLANRQRRGGSVVIPGIAWLNGGRGLVAGRGGTSGPVDENKEESDVAQLDDPNWKADLTYQIHNQSGDINGSVEAIGGHPATPMDTAKSFPLTSRGFHWINEHPFNQ